jgi:hypothetical protein
MSIFSKLTTVNFLARRAWKGTKALILKPDRREAGRGRTQLSPLLIWECELPHQLNCKVWNAPHEDLRANDWEISDAPQL